MPQGRDHYSSSFNFCHTPDGMSHGCQTSNKGGLVKHTSYSTHKTRNGQFPTGFSLMYDVLLMEPVAPNENSTHKRKITTNRV